jgi:hypothetical protein
MEWATNPLTGMYIHQAHMDLLPVAVEGESFPFFNNFNCLLFPLFIL